MKITEYKNEVNTLTLSDKFKQELKDKLIAMADESPARRPEIKKSTTFLSKKYSRYVALAACLLLVVSTVSVVSIGGLRSKFDKALAEPDAANFSNKAYDDDQDAADAEDATYGNTDASDEAVSDPVLASDVPDSDLEDPAVYSPTDNEPDVPTDDEDEEPIVAHPLTETNPMSVNSNGYSSYASPDYEGNYSGADYIVSNLVGSASNFAEYVTVEVNIIPETVIEPRYDYENYVKHSFTTSGAFGEQEAPAQGAENSIPESEEDINYENPKTSGPADIDFDDLTSGWSYSYYGLRDGVISDLDGIALIRFTIEDAYDSFDAAFNIASPVTMGGLQTLYNIGVTYDYFENEEVSADRLLLNVGTEHWQLVGRPLMEGEYVALVTENKDGVLEPVSQLVYAIHRVNGLDIAYHVYSDDGFMIDPGSTNMGLMPEEREVITSTTNNPEIYTQKAAVKELTYYLRRNILRMDPKLLDIESGSSARENTPEPSASEPPDPNTVQNAQTEEIEYRSGIRANFPTGELKVTVEDDETKVNGIGIGDDMDAALKAFYLTKYHFTPDARLVLIASEEDGRWQVVVKFENGIVTSIERQ